MQEYANFFPFLIEYTFCFNFRFFPSCRILPIALHIHLTLFELFQGLLSNNVWFSPIGGYNTPETQDEIKRELNKPGVNIWQTITQKERPGFGTSAENVIYEINEFEKQKISS